jgi:DNA-binding IclR family transcriptional regulator
MRVGVTAPLYASAAGRVILAYAPAERRDEYLARAHFKSLTPATRVTLDAIEENLRSVRAIGYCASFGEMLKDTAAIAAPVFDASEANIGALLVAAPLDRMRRNFDTLLPQVLDYSRQASGLAPGSESLSRFQSFGSPSLEAVS